MVINCFSLQNLGFLATSSNGPGPSSVSSLAPGALDRFVRELRKLLSEKDKVKNNVDIIFECIEVI